MLPLSLTVSYTVADSDPELCDTHAICWWSVSVSEHHCWLTVVVHTLTAAGELQSLSWVTRDVTEGSWVFLDQQSLPRAAAASVSSDDGRPPLLAPSPPPWFSVLPWRAWLWRPLCGPAESWEAGPLKFSGWWRQKGTTVKHLFKAHWDDMINHESCYLWFDLSFLGFGVQRRWSHWNFSKRNMIYEIKIY